MQSSLSLSAASPAIAGSTRSFAVSSPKLVNLRFCGLRREALGFGALRHAEPRRARTASAERSRQVVAAKSDNGSAPSSFDYDLVIIGAGVGGHGAALHAVEKVRPRSDSFLVRFVRKCGFELAILGFERDLIWFRDIALC